MDYKQAFSLVDELTIEVINNLPKIESMLDMSSKSKIIAQINDDYDRILKSLKPTSEYTFDMFNSEDIYDYNKIIDVYKKVILSRFGQIQTTINGKNISTKYALTSFEEKCYETIKASIDIKLRSNKFNKIK